MSEAASVGSPIVLVSLICWCAESIPPPRVGEAWGNAYQ